MDNLRMTLSDRLTDGAIYGGHPPEEAVYGGYRKVSLIYYLASEKSLPLQSCRPTVSMETGGEGGILFWPD